MVKVQTVFSKRRLRFISGVIVLLSLLISAGLYISKNSDENDFRTLKENWTIESGGEIYRVSDISRFRLPKSVRKGDSLEMRISLRNLKENSALRIQTSHSALRVFINGSLEYAYGMEDFHRGKMVGGGMHIVPIPSEASDKDITIRLFISASDAFNTAPVVRLYPERSVYLSNCREHLSVFLFGLFLALIGLVAMLICLCIFGFSNELYRLFLIGLLSNFLGVWTLGYTKLLQVFSTNLTGNNEIEFITLFLSPLVMELLLIDMCRDKVKRWKYLGIWGFLLAGALFFCVAVSLHVSDIAHFPVTLPYFHAYAALGILYLLLVVLPDRKGSLSEKILYVGITAFVAICACELARFYIQQRFSLNDTWWEITLIPLALLVLFVSLIVSFSVYLYKAITAKTERDLLTRMAYRDFLTGLYNRAKSNQVSSVLEMENTDYAVVSIDMNGLKHMNDHFGHAMGDRLIVAFASVFKKSFDGVGTTIRMGGDEFMAIVRAEHFKDLEKALDNLRALEKETDKDFPVPMSAAYGIAFRSECAGKSFEDVCRLADSRMYKMKVDTKQARED